MIAESFVRHVPASNPRLANPRKTVGAPFGNMLMEVALWICFCLVCSVSGYTSDDFPLLPDQMMDACIDSKLHKENPGPEDSLFSQCSAWKDHSCCTKQVSEQLHANKTWLNFNIHHCGNLSDKCDKQFRQDLCFYECSPNTGPWLVKVDMKIRKTRFFELPLCAKDCDAWFEDCKDDLTCVDNWAKGFIWKNGNKCPSGAECKTFSVIFGNSSTFCEQVWDHSFRYTTTGPCMTRTPDPKKNNSNRQAALFQVNKLKDDAKNLKNRETLLITLIVIVLQLLLYL